MKRMMRTILAGAAMIALAGTFPERANAATTVRNGTLDAITDTTVQVGELSCITTGGTKYQDASGTTVTRDAFTAGAQVKLKCRATLAISLQLRNEEVEGGGGKPIRFEGGFSASSGVTTSAAGSFKYRNKKNGSGRDDNFTASVKIPLPSTVPAAADKDAAKALVLSVRLLRTDTAYALCSVRFERVKKKAGAQTAEYRAQIREKKTARLFGKKLLGSCDNDLATEGVQAGLPAIEAGDTVIVEDSVGGAFLEATVTE